MNRLQGNVVAWETSGDLCLVEVEVAGARLRARKAGPEARLRVSQKIDLVG